jgi:hypothetical protein
LAVAERILLEGVRFEDLGPRALKGVPDAWRLYRLIG